MDTTTAKNAPHVVAPDQGPTLPWGPAGGTMRIIAGAESTAGCFSVCEMTEPPGGGAPLHVHHREAEAFYVLEGEVQVICGEMTATAGAGSFVFAPRDVPHKFAVLGDRPLRMLLLFSRPGFETFFREAAGAPPEPGTLSRYGLEILEQPEH